MLHRRKFLKFSSLGLISWNPTRLIQSKHSRSNNKPVVLSTWDAGMAANEAAWKILTENGSALDAVEAGVKVTESSLNCCVGLGANPDRDGIVTLDACIMDHQFNCGSVVFLERIKHPISVARAVMEKTPHVMLAGSGAQQFAVQNGFTLEPQKLSEDAEKNYRNWLKKSEYKPIINIENTGNYIATTPPQKINGNWNHDTIGMLAMDLHGNLSDSCTTSGQAFKMRGRIGDSPIIGAGLYVDNEVGAAAATGQGEDIIRICGSYSVVEWMRQGYSPTLACKKAVEKLAKIKGKSAKDIQACFIAISKNGEIGGFALQRGFSYAVYQNNQNQLIKSSYLI